MGWFDEDNNPWSFEQEITEDITLYAVWRPIDNTRYTVQHIYVDGQGTETVFSESNAQTGRIGDTVTARALNQSDSAYTEGLKNLGVTELYLLPDATTKSLQLTNIEQQNVITFYYSTGSTRDYVVHYYLEGTTTKVEDDKNVTGTEYSMVTEKAKDISGYDLVTSGLTQYPAGGGNYYQTAALKSRTEGKNEIIFYYRPAGQTAMIVPADVTIYMGGDGYEGAVNQGGTGLQATNGFPEPGFVIVTPSGITNFDPTKATLKYVDSEAGINRSWNIVSYDGKTGHNIYRFEPIGDSNTPVRMQFKTEDGKYVTEDEFTIQDHLDQDLTMEVYGKGVDANKVTLEYGSDTYTIATGTGTLKVRSTTKEVQYGDVATSENAIEESKPGVVAPADTTYYINNSAVQVTGGDVALLFDDIVENNTVSGRSNTDLLKARTNTVLGSAGGTRHDELKYLDLVATDNGNVWVAADRAITVYWPLPAGTDGSTSFKLVHFKGLHHEMGVDEVEDKIESCQVETVTVQNTGTHVKFLVNPISAGGGFSPFVLVWDTPTSSRQYTLHYVSNGGTPYDDEKYPPNTVVKLDKVPVREGNLTGENQFTDVNEGNWFNNAISTMTKLGIVKGRTSTEFAPNAPITRAEFAAICARFDTGKTEGDSNFTDISGHWAEAEIERAVTLGWITGYPDGTFRPDKQITRAEAMTTINRVLQRLPETESDLMRDMVTWPDNQSGAWYYLAVQEATNSHDFDRKDDGVHEKWTKINPVRHWSDYEH